MRTIVGVFDNEVFIYEHESSLNGDMIFTVARIVESDMLENLRDAEFWAKEHRDEWVEAVKGGYCDDSLENWAEQVISEEMDESDEEDFPCKDAVEELSPYSDERKKIDEWIEENTDIEVGTWECCGFYSPNSFSKNFEKFDLVINEELAERYYKQIKNKK